MEKNGYWTLFWAMAIEGTGLPIPMEFLFIPAGFAVTQGKLSLGLVIAVSTSGGVFGNIVGYLAGRYFGPMLIRRFGQILKISQESLEKVSHWFEVHGGRTIFLSRFFGFIRAPSILSAGIAGMDLVKYVAYSALGGVIWNGFWAVAAWLFGAQLPILLGKFYPYFGLIVTLLIGGAFWFRSRNQKSA